MKYELSEIARICGGRLSGEDRTVESVFTDSRSFVNPDSLFVAICGGNHDGHSYIGELYGRGIRAFIIEKDVPHGEIYGDAGFIRVESSVDALQNLASDYRAKFRGKVTAITGSNGKTIVKEWAAALVPDGVKVFRSPKSYNSQIGVPLSVLMIEGDEELAIIEAGISKPGEMAKLEKIIKPDIGVITTIGDAHQENFGSLEQKTAEKLELFRDTPVIIYNSAYPLIESLLRDKCPDARLVDSAEREELCGLFDDRASRENAVAAVALCMEAGYDIARVAGRIPLLSPVAMRLEVKEGVNGSLIINDTYNSDINSLAIALDRLGSIAGGRRKTLILSDIPQSGFPDGELYGKVSAMIELAGVDNLVGIGEKIGKYGGLFTVPATFYPSADAFLSRLRKEDMAGRAILLKGSRSSQFERISRVLESRSHTTVLEIDLDALIHNLNVYRSIVGQPTRIMAMVKAAGYGNGLYETAAVLQHQGVDYLAVAFADEGVLLREQGITMPIVVLNADRDSFDVMAANRLEPEIYSFDSLYDFAKTAGRFGEINYPVHIKVDTGMHRLGFSPKDIDGLIAGLAACRDRIRVASVFSHLASSDEEADDGFTLHQTALFHSTSEKITGGLGYKPLLHIANSAAAVRFPESRFDMIRLGIGLYGIGTVPAGTELKPVSSLKTRIVQIRDVACGESVGYGLEGRLPHDARIATIPVGYADGLDRRLGCGGWSVLVGCKAAPTVGRICMDTCMIDVTDTGAVEGDEVTVFGDLKGNRLEDMAHALGTIPYEIMTGISSRVKRIFMKE